MPGDEARGREYRIQGSTALSSPEPVFQCRGDRGRANLGGFQASYSRILLRKRKVEDAANTPGEFAEGLGRTGLPNWALHWLSPSASAPCPIRY